MEEWIVPFIVTASTGAFCWFLGFKTRKWDRPREGHTHPEFSQFVKRDSTDSIKEVKVGEEEKNG